MGNDPKNDRPEFTFAIIFLTVAMYFPRSTRRIIAFIILIRSVRTTPTIHHGHSEATFRILDIVWRLEIAFKQMSGGYEHTRDRANDPRWKSQWQEVIVELETALWATLQSRKYNAAAKEYTRLKDLADDRKVIATQRAKRILGI